MNRKNLLKTLSGIIFVFALGACNNYFHDLIPSDDTLILSFDVDGLIDVDISANSVVATVQKGTDTSSLIPRITVSRSATLLPVTVDYVRAAFPSADLTDIAMRMYKSSDFESVKNLIEENPDFNVPALNIPIDFSGPVAMIVVSGQGSTRQYTVNVVEDSGEPRLLNLRFAKYDNAELISDALCMVNEASSAVYANAVYPAEMNLSFALIPSFNMLGDSFEVDGMQIVSGEDAIQFNSSLGMQTKTITITRDGLSKDYTLTIIFTEDKDSIRSITDFRFNKADNPSIAANAVGSIINTDNTGTITVQVFYNGAKPQALTPRFISPGTVSVGGVTQTSGSVGHDFSSSLEYRVVSKNGMYTRIYTVRVEFISVANNTPRITSFRFSAALHEELVQDSQGQISDGRIMIDAYYGGTQPPESLKPEFSAEGIVTVYGSVQVSGASGQDFSRQIKYTVTNPEYPSLTLDYWVQCKMTRDTSSDAAITAFSFHPDENSGLADIVTGKIDQNKREINVYAPIGSGFTIRTVYPRFTAAGQVSVSGTAQTSGVSGRIFDSPVTYTVVSANGKNTRSYVVNLRELQSTIYVKHDANGMNDGMSWNDAFISLKAACEAAALFPEDVPKEIWIAKGTYTPGNKAGDYFPLTANTSYIGGFAGNETAKSERNVAANMVIISGDLGGGTRSQRLFYNANVNGDLLFENLRLRNASGYGIYASNENGNIEINNLEIQDISGYGIYCLGTSDSVLISNINARDISTYAVFIQGAKNEVVLKDSNFTNSRLVIYRLTSSSSRAEVSGVGFNNITNGHAITIDTAIKISIDRIYIDRVSNGSGIYIQNIQNTILISNSTIKNCSSTGHGGGIALNNNYGNIEILNTTISNNNAPAGGGVSFDKGNLTINECTISDNTSNSLGGGLCVIDGTLTMNGGTISGNTVGRIGGGGVYVQNGTFTMNGGTISGNTAISPIGGSGGGVYVRGTLTMNNGTISGNTATSHGGGVIVLDGTLAMNGGAISRNTAAYWGGGVYIQKATFTMGGGMISGNTVAGGIGGGGVGLFSDGNFIKTGGTIYGNDGTANANTVRDTSGTIVNGMGHVLKGLAIIDTTLGPSDNLSW